GHWLSFWPSSPWRRSGVPEICPRYSKVRTRGTPSSAVTGCEVVDAWPAPDVSAAGRGSKSGRGLHMSEHAESLLVISSQSPMTLEKANRIHEVLTPIATQMGM